MSATKHSFNWLPDDLILEVFLRLPRKPLIRLRCLSKRLRNLIDCPLFKKRYDVFYNFVSDFKVMIIGEDHRMFSIDFHLPDSPNSSSNVKEISTPHPKFNVFKGCCKGIVCLFGSPGLQQEFILWNPYNGTFQNVNSSGLGPLESCRSSIGFGYDYATDDYKIVRLTIHGDVLYVDVYSMRRDSWGRIVGKFSPGRCSYYTIGIYVEGAIHWLWINVNGCVFSCIAAFDLETESFRSVPLQPQLQSNPYLKLHDLGGRLSLLVKSPTPNSSSIINVWVMKEYGVATSWTPLFNIRIEIDNIIGHFPMWDDARLLCLGPDSRLWSWLNTQDGTKENIQIHKLPHVPEQGYYGGIRSWVCVRSPLRLRRSYMQND